MVVDYDIVHHYGKFRTNDFSVTLGRWWDNQYFEPSAEAFLGNSTIFLNGIYNAAFAYLFYAPGTFHAGTSSFIFQGTGFGRVYADSYDKPELYNVTFKNDASSFRGGSIKNKLIFEKSGEISLGHIGSGSSDIQEVEFFGDALIYDSRNYHSMKFAPGKRYTFYPGSTQTLVPHLGIEGQFIAQGLPGQYIEMKSSDPNIPAIIHKDDYDGTSTCTKYLFLTGMDHTGTEDIYVPTPGGDVFNNDGWQFFPCNPCPASIPVLAASSITVGCPPGKASLILDGLKPDEWANWYTDPAAMTNLVYSGGTPGPAGNMFMPVITGPATYYARVYSDGGLCESTVILTVNITTTTPPALFNVKGGGTVCAGSNGAPVWLDGSQIGVSYQLFLDGVETGLPRPGTGDTLQFGLKTAPGIYTVVATKDGTACSATMTGSAVILDNASQAPAVTVSSNGPLCEYDGNSLQLTESGGAATSWAWTGPGGYTSTDQNPVIFSPMQNNSGTYTVVVSDGQGCTNIASVGVLVQHTPQVALQSNNPTCGSDLMLYESGGEAVAWGWFGPNGSLGSSGFPNLTIPNVTPADNGFYVVVGLGANGCMGYAGVQVNVQPASAGTISGSPTVCPGQMTPLTINGAAGGTWSSGSPTIATVNSMTGVVKGMQPGMAVITYTVLVGGCVQTADFSIQVWPQPAVAISGDNEVCENETLILTETGGSAVSWAWYNGSGLVTTNQILNFSNPTFAQFGGYASVVVTDANGCTNARTVDVITYAVPPVTASSNAPFCAGSDDLHLTESGGGQGVSWMWSGPIGYTSTQQNPVIVNPLPGTYTVKVTDFNGCTDQASLPAIIHNLPTVTCPPTLFVGLADPPFPLAGATPAGGDYVGPNVTNGTFDPLAAGLGSHPVTYGYTDANGCSNECGLSVTVQNLAPPTITCPANIVKSNDPGQCGAVVNYPLPTTTAPVGTPTLILLSGLPTGGSFPVGITVIVWQATGSTGLTATCSFTVTVNDGQNPTLVCPANIARNTDAGLCSATVNYAMITANDNCPGWSLVRTSGLPSGSVFPKGVNMVNWKITDAAGNMAICGFTVTVSDNQAPGIVCPTDIVRSTAANSCYSAAVFYALKGLTDNCPGTTAVFAGSQPTPVLTSGTPFPKGVTIVTLKATDGTGLTKICTFSVTVNDAQPPAITCPANIALNTATNLCTAIATYTTPTFTDNCTGGNVAIQSGLTSGSAFLKGQTTVVWKATDAAGNTKTCTFRVTVNDAQAPLIVCPASLSVPASPGQCGAAAVTYTPPTFPDNCAGGTLTRTGGPASGAAFSAGATPVTWRATDAAGNFSVCTFTVTVTDAQPPAITCSPNLARNTDADHCSAVVTYPQPTATDNCAGATVFLLTGLASYSEFPLGTTVNVWRAFDLAGLSSTCSVMVTVSDAQVPTLVCPPNATVNASGNPCGWPSNQLTLPTATDNCAVTSLTSNASASLPPGLTTVIWTAKDAANNAKTCSQKVTVECGTAPQGVQSSISPQARESLKLGQGLGLLLAPNPAATTVTVTMEGVGEHGGVLTVFDALGRTVWSQQLGPDQRSAELDVSGAAFASGLYQVSLWTEWGRVTRTLVVSRL